MVRVVDVPALLSRHRNLRLNLRLDDARVGVRKPSASPSVARIPACAGYGAPTRNALPEVIAVRPLISLLCLVLALSVSAQGLLNNPDFEDPAGWSRGWTIENLANNGSPYVYHLSAIGGGHGKARPHGGDNAIEIYSSDRVTRLSQQVTLEPGTYRLAVWARNNGASIDPQLRLLVGGQTATVPVLADRYRQYFADFEIKQAGPQLVGFQSVTLGLALDDVSLTKLAGGEVPPPYLFFDLSPTSEERSNGVQTYLRGQKQWLNFTISTDAPKLVKKPVLRITAPADVIVSGFNTFVLDRWRRGGTDPVLTQTAAERDKQTYNVYEVQVPRFVNGESSPVSFGGCWVEVPGGGDEMLTVELLDGGQMVSSEKLQLEPVELLDPPSHPVTPKRLKIVFYGVQNWMMSPAERLAALPQQFAMMGGNVWSDYTITQPSTPATPTIDDLVRERAACQFQVREFWPNYSSLLETGEGISAWGSAASQYHDPDMFMVSADGKVNSHIYNLRYAAGKGEAWMKSTILSHQKTLSRPKDISLAYRNNGFITDALEGVPVSYDKTTLADFAKQAGLDQAAVTVEAVRGNLSKQWLQYNMKLYAQVAANLAEAIRQVDPKAAVVNTAGDMGPGGVGSLTPQEQASWAKTYDYTMPQWYATGFFGDYYYSLLQAGLKAGIYGKGKGYADVIPLWDISMGAGLNDALSLRFQSFDLLSASPVVKGVGYYIGTNAFADARTMVDLSALHTLLAEVEDYYVLGQPVQGATFEPEPGGVKPIMGMDAEGKQTELTPKVETSVRVHKLGKGRGALLTIISHCNQGVGERGKVRLDFKALGVDPKRDVLYDLLTGEKLKLEPVIEVDTSKTGNMGLLEITPPY